MALVTFLSWRLNPSIAFVVYIRRATVSIYGNIQENIYRKRLMVFLVDCGIIDPYTMLKQVNMIKEKKVKSVHTYTITTYSDGRLGTWVADESKLNGWRNIKAANYEALIDKLYDYYYGSGLKERQPRLCDIFEEWLGYKGKKKNNSTETIKQNRASYEKYVRGTDIDIKPLNSIKTIDLENWAIDVLINQMTAKSFNTHKIVLTGSLRYAKRKGLINDNPWKKEELEYTHLFKSERRKPSASMVFYPDEIEELIEEFERGFE